MTTKTATFVLTLADEPDRQAALYKLSEPVTFGDYDEEEKTTSFVMVSAITHAPSAFGLDEPETYIFPANEHGEVLSWGELYGSAYREAASHQEVLKRAGYTLEG